MNVNKIFGLQTDVNKKTKRFLFTLLVSSKTTNILHNLSSVPIIPDKFRALLMLGLKFCTVKNPDLREIRKCTTEAIRKISWKIFFQCNPVESRSSKFKIDCIKDFRKLTLKTGKECHISKELFNVKELQDRIMKYSKKFRADDSKIYVDLINQFKSFCKENSLMVIEADKNAGICIVNVSDYEKEVFRQLNDLNTYHPSTQSAFDMDMIVFKDKLNVFCNSLPDSHNIKNLQLPKNCPSKFYILPKIHKKFDNFPKGRPISSTFNKNNKYASRLLESILKPCLYEVTDLLIDTQHFLLELETVKLNPDKSYSLITIDVEALYPSLLINDCKRHCIESYLRNRHLNSDILLNKQQVLQLLSLSLDYSYVNYNNNFYFQHKGIEMGNAASVAIANITVFHEIKHIFTTCDKVVFYKRFLDDIFVILETSDVTNVDEWLDIRLKHNYLKFTHESNNNFINFLDVLVKLDDNNVIHTELYQKPMSKHVYLHALSDHPLHLKNSLFYSQGLRVIRLCSEFNTRVKRLDDLYNKFVSRGYANKNLKVIYEKLLGYERSQSLKPKKHLLISYLEKHNIGILNRYGINTVNKMTEIDCTDTYIVFPFYKQMFDFKQKILCFMHENLHASCSPRYKEYTQDLNIRVVFQRTKNLKELLYR